MSVLDLKDEDKYDTIIAINCLHHVIGRNVAQCYENLTRIFEVTFRALQPEGKLVVIESTVFSWFLNLYKPLFPILLKMWPLKPSTHFSIPLSATLSRAADSAGFRPGETTWIPKSRQHHDPWSRVTRLADADSSWKVRLSKAGRSSQSEKS